ncbi:MAG: hypothetical protein Unbinned8472contig1000_37 [Prokaryotic dsDNA virus sp.]|nr:MAG: hypothetical protein Unbinned8472contig1000_37 [Prokaryotic dsDNA virus sp.]|tara:strand:- start:881 stop:1111 length:231 start_codon:yes stop_codon:yes gene_type:complete
MKSMKSNVKVEEELTFPCLRESLTSGAVVIFTDQKKGTVVHVGEGSYHLGYYSLHWIKATDSDTWKTPNFDIILKP